MRNASDGKVCLGSTTKKGQRDLRGPSICGAVTVVRWVLRMGAPQGSWLAAMLARKPRVAVAVALANRIARVAPAFMA